MAPIDGTDPLPIPLDGDGAELIGVTIDGRYRLDAAIGRGGMGLVYRATHVGMRRQVAVKILHPSLATSPDVRSRFEREALAVGKVDHPNCVATYDVGRLPDGALYLAMELLEGRSLADVLEQERQIAPGRALHILAHVLRGLGAVHANGLIHRDIKPENIFLIRQGEDMDFAKILDFGIAKPMSGELSDDGVRLTQAGMAFGTPIYMSPEQALGNKMDGRSDLYAAAVIAYEMLAGQPPFYSEDKLEVMSMHTAKPVPPMRTKLIRGGKPVPSSIEKLIARGLTKKVNDRYASAEIFLAEVEEALHTPDGGRTDVLFDRPEETGARPLLDELGQVDMGDDSDGEHADAIANDIDEVLAGTPTTVGRPYKPAKKAAAKVPLPGLPDPVPPGRGSGRSLPRAPDPAPPVVAAGDPRGRGGVGIGIPYTGPAGEPIFGLTPEQRLAQVPRKRRWPLYAAIAGAAAVVGILIAVLTAPSSSNKLDPSTPAGAAEEALDQADAPRALKILDEHKTELANDPDGQLIYGHAYASLGRGLDALAAYRKAIALAPDIEADQVLRANLRVFAAQKDPEVVRAAFDVWAGHTTDPEGQSAIAKAAVSQDIARRHAVYATIDKYKLHDTAHVDLVAAYVLDLEQETSCELRKEAVGKLRTLRDPRAVEPLEVAVAKKIVTRGPQYGKPLSPCLIKEANEAIGFLRGLQAKSTP